MLDLISLTLETTERNKTPWDPIIALRLRNAREPEGEAVTGVAVTFDLIVRDSSSSEPLLAETFEANRDQPPATIPAASQAWFATDDEGVSMLPYLDRLKTGDGGVELAVTIEHDSGNGGRASETHEYVSTGHDLVDNGDTVQMRLAPLGGS